MLALTAIITRALSLHVIELDAEHSASILALVWFQNWIRLWISRSLHCQIGSAVARRDADRRFGRGGAKVFIVTAVVFFIIS
jgi:hypothetical protein